MTSTEQLHGRCDLGPPTALTPLTAVVARRARSRRKLLATRLLR